MRSEGKAVWNGDLFGGSGEVSLVSSGAAGPLPVSWASRTEAANGKTSPEELIATAQRRYPTHHNNLISAPPNPQDLCSHPRSPGGTAC